MKPVKEGFAVDLQLAQYRLSRVAFKRFPIQIEWQAVAEAGTWSACSRRSTARNRAVWAWAVDLPVDYRSAWRTIVGEP
jgi:2-methylcitrate dehydratase